MEKLKKLTEEQLRDLRWGWSRFIKDLSSVEFWREYFDFITNVIPNWFRTQFEDIKTVFRYIPGVIGQWFREQWGEIISIMKN